MHEIKFRRLYEVLHADENNLNEEFINHKMRRLETSLQISKLNAEEDIAKIEERLQNALSEFRSANVNDTICAIGELLQDRDDAKRKLALADRIRDYLNGGTGDVETNNG